VDDVVIGAAGRCRSLARQDLVVVAMKWLAANTIALACRARDQFAEWTRAFAGLGRPVQPVFLALLADDPLGVSGGPGAGASTR